MPDLVFLPLLLVLVVVRIEGSQSDLPPVVVEVEYKDRARNDPDLIDMMTPVLVAGAGRVGGSDLDPDSGLCWDRVRERWRRRAGNRTVYVSPSLGRRTIFDSGQAVQVDSAALLQTELGIDFEAASDTEVAVAVEDDRLRLVAAQLGRCRDDYQYHLTGNAQALSLSKWDAIERTW
jgi:hypothetical protein